MNKLNKAEIGWLAGLIDGEGCISVYKPKNRNNRTTEIVIGMTDFDVIDSLYKITGVGTLNVEERKSGNRKPLKRWKVAKSKDVRDVLATIATVEQLSIRKKLKIIEAMDALDDVQFRINSSWSRVKGSRSPVTHNQGTTSL